MIVRLQIFEIKRKQKAGARGRKSKFHSAHVHLHYLEVLNAKFHNRATSNFGDLARTDRQTHTQTDRQTDEPTMPFIYRDYQVS